MSKMRTASVGKCYHIFDKYTGKLFSTDILIRVESVFFIFQNVGPIIVDYNSSNYKLVEASELSAALC
jgi:hypothetical protein